MSIELRELIYGDNMLDLYILMVSEDVGSHYEDFFVAAFSTLDKAKEGAYAYQRYMESRYRNDGKGPKFSQWKEEDGEWFIGVTRTRTGVDSYTIRRVQLDVLPNDA